MQGNQCIVICLILIAMVLVAIFMADVIASSLIEGIMNIATVAFTAIFTIIMGFVLFIASIVIGLLSCVGFTIGGLIVYLRKKFRSGKYGC